MSNRVRSYEDQTHLLGKIWVWGMGIMMLLFPVAVSVYYGAWPEATALFKGLLAIAPMPRETCPCGLFCFAVLIVGRSLRS